MNSITRPCVRQFFFQKLQRHTKNIWFDICFQQSAVQIRKKPLIKEHKITERVNKEDYFYLFMCKPKESQSSTSYPLIPVFFDTFVISSIWKIPNICLYFRIRSWFPFLEESVRSWCFLRRIIGFTGDWFLFKSLRNFQNSLHWDAVVSLGQLSDTKEFK